MFEALLTNRTVSVLVEALPRILTAGLTMTIPLTLLSFFFAMIIAVAVALVQYANVPVLRQIARFYIWVIRGTPLLVQLFIIFYGLPSVGIMLNAFPAAVIAFAFNEGAYCAETMRGALESVPQGQLEAGYCVGMSWWQIMRRIVLPQALRTAVPALSNSLIGMIKDTSLASNITVAELFMAGQRVAARTYIFLPIYCEVAVVYLYIGCYQHIVAYLNDIVVYKRTVHIDDNLITDENVLPVFAMEINIDVNMFSHLAEQIMKDSLSLFRVGIIRFI